MLNQFSLNRLLGLVTAIGFAFLLVDTTLEHWKIFANEILAFVPVLFSALGLVVGTVAVIRWNERWIRLLQAFLLASVIVGAVGVYLHVKEEDEEEILTTEEQKEADKPPLAPLAFGGVAVVGLVGTFRKWHAEVL